MSEKLFRSAINGYNKTEVDEYALHISRKIELQKREYEKKLEVLELEIKRLKSEKKAVEDKLSEDEAIISAFRAKLEGEATSKEAAPAHGDSDILQKSQRYDEISRMLGEIIANANADAAAVKRKASEEAERIVSEAKSSSAQMRSTAVAEISSVAEVLAAKLNEITSGFAASEQETAE